MGLLLAVFVGMPLLEIVVFVTVGGRIGLLNVVLLVVATGIIGATVASRQGSAVFRRAQVAMREGRFPGREIAHGAMVLVGGVLLITPGFITDGVGFLLMVPPVREALTRWGRRRFQVQTGTIDI